MNPQPRSLQRRLLLGFVGVAVVTGLLTAVVTVSGFLVLANQHPIGANRVGQQILALVPANTSTAAVALALVATGLLLVVLAMSTALSIAERVLRPVADLAGAADRMATGDLGVRLRPEGDDEIAEVARSFNQMADNLGRSVATLQQMEATARRFAADVSHELRTPLAAMTAVTDVLSAHAQRMDDEAAQATRLVVQEIANLHRLVDDLIEISRFDAGTAVLDAESVQLRPAIEASLERRGWSDLVDVDVAPDLCAQLDLRRFDVIVANLVGNAVKYGRPPLEIRARYDGPDLLVDVTDHGSGVAAEALPHLFERFYKADTARARSDGSGLGLAIALENARLHGGDIRVSNRPEGGAAFRLRLPAAS